MSDDTVIRIEMAAFYYCTSLAFVKLSRNLEYIGDSAFKSCRSLTSIFIPPTCRRISQMAFFQCHKLIIFNVPRQTQLRNGVIGRTALIDASSFQPFVAWGYSNTGEVNEWAKSINAEREYSLHRLYSSTYENEAWPFSEAIYETVKEHGPQVLQAKNTIGITPLKYLEENPYLENIDEMKMLKRFVLEKMGQHVVV